MVAILSSMILPFDPSTILFNIIENTIKTHKDVEECMVVGVHDPDYSQGYLPKAHIVLKPHHKKTERTIKKELEELCRDKLPEYSQPVYYKFRETFPYTPIGKVDFMALQEEDISIKNKTV